MQHLHTSAYHPAATGVVERKVEAFKHMLTALVSAHPEHWLQSVPVVRMQYWSWVHAALEMFPMRWFTVSSRSVSFGARLSGCLCSAAVDVLYSKSDSHALQ